MIMATYKARLSAPSTTDKNWIHYTKGGYNYCIHIKNGSCLPNCFTGDTKIITSLGLKRLDEIVDKEVYVLTKDKTFEKAIGKSYGKQPVYEVKLKNGLSFKASANHRWFTTSQSNKTLTEKTTLELRVGDYIPYNQPIISREYSEKGIINGFMFGDGTVRKTTNTSSVLLCGKKIDYMDFIFKQYPKYNHSNGVVEVPNFPVEYKMGIGLNSSKEDLLGFLIGYLASDGCVDKDGSPTISSSTYENVKLVEDICAILGFKTTRITTEVRDIKFGEYEYNDHILYRIRLKREGLFEEMFLNPSHKEKFNSCQIKGIEKTQVVDIVDLNKEENVYCVEEPKTHTMTLEGNILTGQCVGYSWGRWREILGKNHNLSRGNAENWWGNTSDGYKRGQIPKLGAVMCWRKGKAGVSSDGAGHVAVVEKINSDGSVTYSNSNYGGTRFYTKTLKAPYKLGSAYTFQGFIYLPIDFDKSKNDTTTTNKVNGFLPSRGYFKYGDTGKNVEKINKFYYDVFPAYEKPLKRNKKNVLGNLFGENSVAWTKEFQRRTGLEADGCIGKITLAELKKYGFKE